MVEISNWVEKELLIQPDLQVQILKTLIIILMMVFYIFL